MKSKKALHDMSYRDVCDYYQSLSMSEMFDFLCFAKRKGYDVQLYLDKLAKISDETGLVFRMFKREVALFDIFLELCEIPNHFELFSDDSIQCELFTMDDAYDIYVKQCFDNHVIPLLREEWFFCVL